MFQSQKQPQRSKEVLQSKANEGIVANLPPTWALNIELEVKYEASLPVTASEWWILVTTGGWAKDGPIYGTKCPWMFAREDSQHGYCSVQSIQAKSSPQQVARREHLWGGSDALGDVASVTADGEMSHVRSTLLEGRIAPSGSRAVKWQIHHEFSTLLYLLIVSASNTP